MTRCASTFFLRPHDVIMSQKRLAGAIVPGALTWDCLRCGRRLGESWLWPFDPRPPRRARWWTVVRSAWHRRTSLENRS